MGTKNTKILMSFCAFLALNASEPVCAYSRPTFLFSNQPKTDLPKVDFFADNAVLNTASENKNTDNINENLVSNNIISSNNVAVAEKNNEIVPEENKIQAISLKNMYENKLEPVRKKKEGYVLKGHSRSADEPPLPNPSPVKEVTKLKKKERVNIASVSHRDVDRKKGIVSSEITSFKIEGLSSSDSEKDENKNILVPNRPKNLFGYQPENNKIKTQNFDKKLNVNNENAFVEAYSAMRPKPKKVQKKIEQVKQKQDNNFNNRNNRKSVSYNISSEDLKKDLYHTYISENKYLSALDGPDEVFDDVAGSDQGGYDPDLPALGENNPEYENDYGVQEMSGNAGADNDYYVEDTAQSNTNNPEPWRIGNIPVLQLKIDFKDGSAALTEKNINVIRSFARVAQDNKLYSIEVAISGEAMDDVEKKRLSARRLAIISQVLRENGVEDNRIKPVLTDREFGSFVFRVIKTDDYKKTNVAFKERDVNRRKARDQYKAMNW